jgi:hypothetical protein
MAGAFEVLCRIAKRELTHISARRHLAPSASVAGLCAAWRWRNSLAVSLWIDFSRPSDFYSQKNSVSKVTDGR